VANIFVAASATWNGKALKKAKKDVDVFSKQVKQFARVFGVAFSATALVAFSKKAVKAFAEDEAAAKSLQLQLQNTGNAFRVTEVEAYIKGLEKTYAILTDLRGPFQTLLNVTGSVDLAQRSLEAALDISAGTTQSLTTVVAAISAGVRGQTKGIKSLNSGIDENILATGDMNKIMEELERRFAGQAAARLDTYAGKMDALKKSTDEATKIIGEGLLDALTILSKDVSIENLTTDFEDLATAIADTVRGMAKVIEKLKRLNNIPGTDTSLIKNMPYIGPALRSLEALRNFGARSGQSGSNFTYEDAGNPRADLLISKNLVKDT
jgi:post-segregation antitoxin (ccd killing protein)